MKNKELILVQITSIIWMLFLGVIIFALFYPFPILNINQPMRILNENKVVMPGETLAFELDYSKPKHYPSTAIKAIYCDSGWVYFYPEIPETLPEGKNTVVSDYTLIPESVPEGSVLTCHLTLDIKIELGFLSRTEGIIVVSEDFYIIN